MNDFIKILSLFIALFLFFPFAYFMDCLRMKRLIKKYNKAHPEDTRDYKKTNLFKFNKQFIDWQISMFASREDGYSSWEKFEELECENNEK